jgi:hypothetical protein
MRNEKYILFLVMSMQRSISIDVVNTNGPSPGKGLAKGADMEFDNS